MQNLGWENIGPDVVLLWAVRKPHGEPVNVPRIVVFGCTEAVSHGDVDEIAVWLQSMFGLD